MEAFIVALTPVVTQLALAAAAVILTFCLNYVQSKLTLPTT
jgi:hypothetical protein